MTKRLIKTLAAIGAAAMLMMPFTVAGTTAFAAAASDKNLDAGSTWFIHKTTVLTGLTITKGAAVRAPEGYRVTMTVDGVETPIRPGVYRGNIVLTPTEDIIIKNTSGGSSYTYHYRAAVYLENGKHVPGKSVAAAVVGGTITDASAKDIKIISVGDNFNGIIATGDSRSSYSIMNPFIDLTGNGGNDFAGYGAAIMSGGKAELSVDKAKIITRGAVRTAVFVSGDSTMRINDSDIEVYNGTLPEEYLFTWTTGGVMMEVPFMLGLTGNVRATNLVENGTAYYNNTHIKAQGWGALSTDASKNVRLYAAKCTIETIESGYGAYALGGSVDTFSGCTFNVADMAMIGAGGDGIFTEGTVVNSRRFGVMYHGSGNLTIDKGTVFNTKSTAIQLKSPGHRIIVDNAQLNAENGIILQTMPNDDPYMPYIASLMAGSGGGQGGPPSGGAVPGDAPAGGGGRSTDVNATFRNTALNGDIVNGDTASADMNIAFENATITGAISSATVKHALGPSGEEITMQNPELYYLIGEVANTYCATDEKYGVTVSLDAGSKWIVDKTSYLTGLTIARGAAISAPKGFSVTMTIDGVKKPIRAGDYRGRIVLTVAGS
jgi:hypothetical protein